MAAARRPVRAHFKAHAAWHRDSPGLANVLYLLAAPLAGMVSERKAGLLLAYVAVLAWALREPLGLWFGFGRLGARGRDALGAVAVLWVASVLRRDATSDPDLLWLNHFAAVAALALGVRAWWKLPDPSGGAWCWSRSSRRWRRAR